KYNGFGASWWEFAAALEGLALKSNDLGFLLSIIAHVGCIRVLLLNGTEDQKNYYLHQLMEGRIGATSITEATGGSDVARIRTIGKFVDSNNTRILLYGHKAHITNAPISDIIILVGRIPEIGNRDITLFILEKNFEGLHFGEKEPMLGNRTSPTGDIVINNVELSNQSILGTAGDGLNILYNMISLDRVLYGIVAAAYMEPLLKKSLEYANNRFAFKTPIANHQYIQKKLTDIKLNIEKSRWVSYAALDYLIKGENEASLLCSAAKYIGTESLFETAQHLVQIHGHKGYIDGDITKVILDSIGTRIAGGTSDIQRINIFNQMQKINLNKEEKEWRLQ
ncbi:acyl-CoA dehydrogenase, partial [Bacillaceae bacterium Marseille-Q3522]|nr:acyl-CoA dehydrogenase [Bacillaceae bacterium Marseille-Q3522]